MPKLSKKAIFIKRTMEHQWQHHCSQMMSALPNTARTSHLCIARSQ